MEKALLDQAVELVEKFNAYLQPELLTAPVARELLATYARIEKLAAFGVAALARKLDDASEIARVTGTSVGRAKAAVTTGKMLAQSDDLSLALQRGEISRDQAAEIAAAEESAPGAAASLLPVAGEQAFHVLKEKSRKAKLEAEQHNDLFTRQHAARSARSYSDELGMVHVHLALEPHVGTPIVARAEAEAQRIGRAAKQDGETESFEPLLADAYAKLLSGSGRGRAKRPELVVLVSHGVAKRGWTEVKHGEVCKIPGVGPISPEVAREIAHEAVVNAVIYDGKDLRNFKRWSRNIPVEVAIALELGDPPEFDGVACVDCGNRFRTEFDHVQPYGKGGPTSRPNMDPRCPPCHHAKTERDRREGRLGPET
jgi:hypothetical protein